MGRVEVPLQWSRTFLTPGTGFVKGNFSIDLGRGEGFGMIQVHDIYGALYFFIFNFYLFILRQSRSVTQAPVQAPPQLTATSWAQVILPPQPAE